MAGSTSNVISIC